jgi:hypothetical protein
MTNAPLVANCNISRRDGAAIGRRIGFLKTAGPSQVEMTTPLFDTNICKTCWRVVDERACNASEPNQ